MVVIQVCLVVLYVYVSIDNGKKIFMRSIYMTQYHWNVKPDDVNAD